VDLLAGPHACLAEYFDALDALARFSIELPPVADARATQAVNANTNFTLDASQSSQPGGGSLQFVWTQIDGPATVIRDEDRAVTVVEGVAGPTTLTFRVTVSGPTGLTGTDDVPVSVRAPKRDLRPRTS
jgi:hypothetical protein